MSRCFPYQPRGLAGKSNDALIVSIKLQEEKQITIPDRVTEKVISSDKKKDRKREKKEKKKDRKDKNRDEKKKLLPTVESEKQKQHNQTVCKVDSYIDESKGKQSCEVVERSNLTEEHGRPVESQNVSCSSDSTGNSGKRKRHSSPANSIQGHGNIIRIRLSSQQKKDVPSMPLALPRPSISQAYAMSTAPEPVIVPSTSYAAPQLVLKEENSQPCLEKKIKVEAPKEDPSTSCMIESKERVKKLSSHERKMLKKESAYTKLFQDLVPPSMMIELVVDQDDKDDWLFSTKDEQKPPKKLKESDDQTCSASAILQTSAHFMSDVGFYALPFIVPF